MIQLKIVDEANSTNILRQICFAIYKKDKNHINKIIKLLIYNGLYNPNTEKHKNKDKDDM